MLNWRMWLKLGRISNLPTVWTNGLAGWVLSGNGFEGAGLLLLMIALSLFYVGGMFLNDAFDAEIDARERATRPIPQGEVPQGTVFVLGTAMLALGSIVMFTLGLFAGLAGLALAATIVAYDGLHKQIAWGPVIMGACRLLTYVTAALAAGGLNWMVLLGAVGLSCHVVGLTYAAKQEAYDKIGNAWPLLVMAVPVLILGFMLAGNLAIVLLALYLVWGGWALSLLFRRQPGDVPKAVVSLIAGIAIYDAVLIAGTGMFGLAVLALIGFGATLALQRVAPGT
ncbi:UbiA family prenyltransferase [Halomonas sp. M20]|uniref:UbiA family prenyltransferase n=1 Tax=Halomonas sp. M20 TaxID=2763264 RepID=UPI001D0B8B13|nr:UbiA family prenyltransferase [Halomonas sp. M20]